MRWDELRGGGWGQALIKDHAEHAARNRQASADRAERRARAATRRSTPEAAEAFRKLLKDAKTRFTSDHEARQAGNPLFKANYAADLEFQAKAGNRDAKLLWSADVGPLIAERRQQLAEQTRETVKDCLQNGYQWPGGLVGGNPFYRLEAFTEYGLRSALHPLLRRFVQCTPAARRIMSGATKAKTCVGDNKLLALFDPYVESTKSMRGVLRSELDRVFSSWDTLYSGIQDLGVPMPSLAVAHVDALGRVWNPHLIWLLADSVTFCGRGAAAPQKLFLSVQDALTASLLPLGADPRGLLNPCRHKNPLSPLWATVVTGVNDEPVTLNELRGGLPINLSDAQALLDAEKERLIASPKRLSSDHPSEAIAAGSNALFGALSGFARGLVADFRDQGKGSQSEFADMVAAFARRISPEGLKAAESAAKRADGIARWTWQNWHPTAPRAAKYATVAELRDAQADAGHTTSRGRSCRTEAALSALAIAFHAEHGHRPRQTDLVGPGRSLSTVKRHWPGVLEALGMNNVSRVSNALSVKKEGSVSVEPELALGSGEPPRVGIPAVNHGTSAGRRRPALPRSLARGQSPPPAVPTSHRLSPDMGPMVSRPLPAAIPWDAIPWDDDSQPCAGSSGTVIQFPCEFSPP